MADLRTRWLGLDLPHPLIAGSSPLADTVDGARRLEEAGAAAIVVRSLFEEQIEGIRPFDGAAMEPEEFVMGPAEYVDHIARLKQAVRIPVIGSLNGTATGPWLDQARRIQAAGADALELNIYALTTDPWDPPQVIERRTVGIVRAVRAQLKIPLSVKLSPFYTSLPYISQEIEEAGADGVVLFNRFYQPDVDIEKGTVTRATRLSDSSELLPRLHELAILFGRFKGSMAVSGGVHTAEDALKAVACGAQAVQLVSVLLRDGLPRLGRMREEMSAWLDRRRVPTLELYRGSLSLLRCPDPKAWERINYLRAVGTRASVLSGGSR
ncbi:MAG TPA: dihydroorotate dehydrogenase-like protein [Planctomycetota bacterium]